MEKILFVCHGNICRSPMAEFVMKDLVSKAGLNDRFQIDSAAVSREEIGNDMYPPARRCLDGHNIPYAKRKARQVRATDEEKYDHIYVMDHSNLRNIHRIIPDDRSHKIELLLGNRDISDPWYTGDFEKAYQDILTGCQKRLDEILKQPEQTETI